MIETLLTDELIQKIGGRFRLTALIQRRWLQLMQGARPMVDTKGKTDMEVVLHEIIEGKIEAVSFEEMTEEEDAD